MLFVYLIKKTGTDGSSSALIKISDPIAMSIIPPITVPFPATAFPMRLPARSPTIQIAKVTAPIISDSASADQTLIPAMVNPTDSASIEVATP